MHAPLVCFFLPSLKLLLLRYRMMTHCPHSVCGVHQQGGIRVEAQSLPSTELWNSPSPTELWEFFPKYVEVFKPPRKKQPAKD